MTAECLYMFIMVCLFPPQRCPFPCWHLDLIIRGSLGPLESGTQMVTWSFQPFLQGSLVWHTDRATERPTDRPRYSVRCSGVIMRNVGYGKATQSFHVSTNNFATIKSPSVRSKFGSLHCSRQSSNRNIYVVPVSHLNTGIQGPIGSRPSDHYFRRVCLSVCLFVCLSVCLFVQSFSQPSLIRFRSN